MIIHLKLLGSDHNALTVLGMPRIKHKGEPKSQALQNRKGQNRPVPLPCPGQTNPQRNAGH